MGFFVVSVHAADAAVCNCVNLHNEGIYTVAPIVGDTYDTETAGACEEQCRQVAGATGYAFDRQSSRYFTSLNPLTTAANGLATSGEKVQETAKAAAEGVGGLFLAALNGILYAVLVFLSLLFALAATVFAWSVNTTVWSELFNMPATYTLWGMVRDFFNLFFILTLLFVAFATIFQIQAYNYRKWLLQLVLMALLVNFSFPVSRFIVDATNVPMYFFIESVLGDSNKDATGVFESLIGTTNIKTMLFPDADKKVSALFSQVQTTGKLIQAIVFVFLLSASLLILAMQFLIRLVMLLVLVIFSPVGFAATAIPGFGGYAKQWWDNFLKYALFGPAAMLMILVSITFLNNFKLNGNSTRVDLVQSYSSGLSSTESQSSLIASMVVTIVPVILIWISMTIGQKMSIAMADTAQKYGMNAMKAVSGVAFAEKRYGSFKNEWKKRSDERYNANNIGTRFGQHTTLVADKAQSHVGSEASRKMSAVSVQTKEQALIKEEAKRRAINANTSNSEFKKQVAEARKKRDGVHMAALLDEMKNRPELHGDMQHGDVEMVGNRFKERGGMNSAVVQEIKEKVGEVNLAAAHGSDIGAMEKVLRSGKVKMENQTANALTAEVLEAALNTNKIDQKIAEELGKDGEKSTMLAAHLGTALTNFDAGFAARIGAPGISPQQQKSLEKQYTSAQQTFFAQNGTFHGSTVPQAGDSAAVQAAKIQQQNKVFEKGDATTLRNIQAQDYQTYMPQIVTNMPIGKTVSVVSTIAEDDSAKAKSFISAARNLSQRYSANGPNLPEFVEAKAFEERLQSDYRTRKLF